MTNIKTKTTNKKTKRTTLTLTLTAIGLTALIAACHPYFNTFYNAEEAFAGAQRRHNKVMRNYPDSIIVAPSEEMTALYERSIEKSLKMMDVFPKEVKRLDRAHYLMGRAAFYKMDFEVSISRMRDLQESCPESPLVPPSHIYVAKAHIMLDNLNIAEELLMKLLEDYPELDNKQEITMLLVEIALRRGGRSHALGLLEGISLAGLPVEKRLEIILRMADMQFELRQYPQALGLLRGAPRVKKLPWLMYRVDRSIYFCHDAMDSLETALGHLSDMERNRRYKEQRYEIHYYRAVTLFRMGRADEAIAILERIRERCLNMAQSDTSSLCGRTSYELANIYMSRGDMQLAMELLEEAMSGRDTTFTNRVSARLVALRKLRELREPDSSGKVSVQARYSIAELFQFDLNSPDSAYACYAELIADGDSITRPKAMLMAALIAKSELADTVRSDSLFRMVIKDYEGSEYARRAQIELNVEVTVVTAEEAAEREFITAEAMTESNMVEAVKAFYNIYKDNPDLEIAPRSLYAAAWYTDNGLGRKRAALILYEELCQKYPESKFCTENAKPRIEIATDSIETRRKRREEAKAKAAKASETVVTDSTGAPTAPSDSTNAVPAIKEEDVADDIVDDDDDDEVDDLEE